MFTLSVREGEVQYELRIMEKGFKFKFLPVKAEVKNILKFLCLEANSWVFFAF